MTNDELGRWIVRPSAGVAAQVRLVCCPYVGGAASAYAGWARDLPEEIEVCAIQLPGRESRYSEPFSDDLGELVAGLGDVVGKLDDLPFAIFGHSMGALLSFELTRELRRRGAVGPTQLFVSACPAPQLPRKRQTLYDLPRHELLREIRQLEGTPEAVLQHAEMVDLLLPIIRADFKICDTYEYLDEPPLSCPIAAIGGTQDRLAAREEIEPWRQQTAGPFSMQMFSGGHFFIRDCQAELLGFVASELLD